jgi:hypothetical protein
MCIRSGSEVGASAGLGISKGIPRAICIPGNVAGVGGRYYATRPDDGPIWGLRFVVTFLFPTG